jgi:hypothetical protein
LTVCTEEYLTCFSTSQVGDCSIARSVAFSFMTDGVNVRP